MSSDWSRPYWKPTGQGASLFYFVVGEPPTDGLAVSREHHHVDPEGDWQDMVQMSAHERREDPDWFAGFFDPHSLGHDIAARFGPGAGALRAAERASVVRAEFPDPPSLDYLRNTTGLVSALLEQGGVGVYEGHHCRWWPRDEWVRCFVDRCAFAITDHIQVVVTDDERHHPGLWSHTRGMGKFGRPDLQIKHIPGRWEEDNPHVNVAGLMLNDFADKLARGKVIPDGWTMRYNEDESAFAFVASPDDSDSPRVHFGNSVLEIVDYDPAKKRRRKGLARFLSEVVAKEGQQ